MSRGIIIVSHIHEVGIGVKRLMEEAAKDVPIAVAAGLEDGEVGTSFDAILEAIEALPVETIYAFYDLGSAKMNLEMASEMSEKTIHIYDTALVESAYTAATLLQIDAVVSVILEQLAALKIK